MLRVSPGVHAAALSAPDRSTTGWLVRWCNGGDRGRLVTSLTDASTGALHSDAPVAIGLHHSPLCYSAIVKVAEILRVLERDGWRVAATRGSHRQLKHPSKIGRVTVPGKPSDDLAPGTLNSILKQAGLR